MLVSSNDAEKIIQAAKGKAQEPGIREWAGEAKQDMQRSQAGMAAIL